MCLQQRLDLIATQTVLLFRARLQQHFVLLGAEDHEVVEVVRDVVRRHKPASHPPAHDTTAGVAPLDRPEQRADGRVESTLTPASCAISSPRNPATRRRPPKSGRATSSRRRSERRVWRNAPQADDCAHTPNHCRSRRFVAWPCWDQVTVSWVQAGMAVTISRSRAAASGSGMASCSMRRNGVGPAVAIV